MKKMMAVIGIILLTIPVLYLSFNKEKDIRDNIVQASEVTSDENDIKYVLVGNKSCEACAEFVPIISKAIKEVGQKVHYLDNEDVQNNYFLKEKNVNVTPTLLILNKKNQIVSRYEGVIRFEEVKKILEGGNMNEKNN